MARKQFHSVTYSVYDKSGVLVAMGNSAECCKALEVSKSAFYSMAHRSRLNLPTRTYDIHQEYGCGSDLPDGSIGSRLTAARLKLGVSATKLSEMAGLSPDVVLQTESGKHTMTFYSAIAVADVLGVSLDYLAGRTEEDEQE